MRHSSAGAPSAPGRTGRLFHHDRLIVLNTARATFAGWHDRGIAALMLPAALAAVHAWFADRPPIVATRVALAAGTLIGIAAGRAVAARLAFHALDGILAADALHPPMRRRYMAAWHGIGLALLVAVTLVVRPSLAAVSGPAYLAGVLLAGLAGGVGLPGGIARTPRPGWTIRAWAQRPVVGVAAATVLLLSLLPARTLAPQALSAVIGVESVLLALMLTRVDAAIVRFMVIAGHGARRIVMRHAGGMLSFLVVAVPGCRVMAGPVAAGIVAAAGGAMLFLLSLRILAYRLHAARFADFLVSILTGLLLLAAAAMPAALPVLALVMLWQLGRRGRARTWLLA